MQYFIAFLSAYFLSIIFTLLIKKIAWKLKIIDRPSFLRKIHNQPIPLLGGVAVFLSFFVVSLYFVFFTDFVIGKYITSGMMYGIWLGGLIIMIGGFIDDKKSLDPIKQIIFPVVAILVVILSGIKIGYITNPFGGVINFDSLNFLAIILTFLWLLGMSYTTKILDGLDGLTSGITLIGTLAIFILTLFIGPAILPEVGIIAIILAGGLFGFLMFNFHKASIFLGEGGSLYCGFMLGVLAIITDGKIAITLLIMGIPIIDLLFVVIQRFTKKQSPFRHSDKKHLHFRLLDIGFSHKQAVLSLYFLTIVFGAAGLFLNSIGRFLTFLILFTLMVLIASGVYFIYKKKNEERLL
jgi:UDP-GlcNAc:undecaprenyl-phosphate/decaprenyl-phosphate GlcNAc-1-phosphate transferase